MTLERGDGFYLGPLCINYGLVVFAYVTPVLLLGFSELIPLKFALAISLFGALILPIFLYRWCWSLWLMVYYFCLPDELHANRPEDSDDLSFEEEQRNVEHWTSNAEFTIRSSMLDVRSSTNLVRPDVLKLLAAAD